MRKHPCQLQLHVAPIIWESFAHKKLCSFKFHFQESLHTRNMKIKHIENSAREMALCKIKEDRLPLGSANPPVGFE